MKPKPSNGRPSTEPRIGMPACLRVQMYCAPWGETTSTPGPSSKLRSSGDARTRPGSIRTAPGRRWVRSCRRSPSQIAHQVTGTPPMKARAAHSIVSAENAPTQRQRLSGRPPRTSGMRAGGSGTVAGPAGARAGLAAPGTHR